MSNNIESGKYVPLTEIKTQVFAEREMLRTRGDAVSLPVALARVLMAEAHEALVEIDGAMSIKNNNLKAIVNDRLVGFKDNIGKVLAEDCVITMEEIIWDRVVDLDAFAARYDFAMSGTRFARIEKAVSGLYPVSDSDWQRFIESVSGDKTYTNALRDRSVWPEKFRCTIEGLKIYDSTFDEFVGNNTLLLHESLTNFVMIDSEHTVAVPKL